MHTCVGARFWSISQPILFDRMLVKPWEGVATQVCHGAKKTVVRLSPIDPISGTPNTSQEDSALVDSAELFCEAIDAWVAYENSLLSIQREIQEDLDKAMAGLREAGCVIEELLKNKNRICHLSPNALGRLSTRTASK